MLLRRCSDASAPYRGALGLPSDRLSALVESVFPEAAVGWAPGRCFSSHVHHLAGATAECHHACPVGMDLTAAELTWLEREEADFLQLLLRNRSSDQPVATAFATVIARACVENDHLWRSLGLAGRNSLADLLLRHFRPLASTNMRKLRWKRFFYERLYTEGRPSNRPTVCDDCSHHPECYGNTVPESLRRP
ncbi:nitrogen fixation protein NifQ [Azospirillum sp. B506]|uniref:nitrogen fixation protein NifQ n=1 Tax=Azospirillum sp. B506 TaxID=137721 RepID=UPI001FCC658C|nr:nitrogen fixation protein NifQ [Azospirillum sp. B506]